jgi:hypothetical protein
MLIRQPRPASAVWQHAAATAAAVTAFKMNDFTIASAQMLGNDWPIATLRESAALQAVACGSAKAIPVKTL